MNYVFYTGDIQSAGSKISRDQYGTTAITKLIERPFTVGLLHTAMKHIAWEFLCLQISGDSFHTFTIVAEYKGRMITKHTKQVIESFQLIFFGRNNFMKFQTRCKGIRVQEIQFDKSRTVSRKLVLTSYSGKLRNFFSIRSRKQNTLL